MKLITHKSYSFSKLTLYSQCQSLSESYLNFFSDLPFIFFLLDMNNQNDDYLFLARLSKSFGQISNHLITEPVHLLNKFAF